jgi:hypothetical protein
MRTNEKGHRTKEEAEAGRKKRVENQKTKKTELTEEVPPPKP